MHAVLVSVTIDSEHVDEARQLLTERIVPSVKELPGVVSGVWIEPQGGQGYSTVVFDTEENAKAAAETVGGRLPDFIKLNFAQVQPVAAHF
ncbi:MAG: hypothetical protein M3290_06105 [Actinomycetota bacterium]|nr:hypothetical protein [Actinomycetota bacterium]